MLTEWLAALTGAPRTPVPSAPLRVAFVKQDVHHDLYCCPPDASLTELLSSTLLRPGPVALFTRWGARFHIVAVEPDAECNIWREKWDSLKWWPIERYEALRNHIPGRPHGQASFATRVADVDWSQYDLVVSCDVCVPARITREFPSTVWAYFVHEVKAPSFAKSMLAPLPGQDLFLNQFFHMKPSARQHPPHVIEFPFHFHHVGWFHEVFGGDFESPRHGVFVEHHTAETLSAADLTALARFGPVRSTALMSADRRRTFDAGEYRRTLEPDCRDALMGSKYFFKSAGRKVLGTAMVEAIAAGCVALGDPDQELHGFFYSRPLRVRTLDDVLRALDRLEANPALYRREVARQRVLLDRLCFARPAEDLAKAVDRVRAGRVR